MAIETNLSDDTTDYKGGAVADGDYLLRVIDTEERFTSNGDPSVNLTLEIQGGDWGGRYVWDSLYFHTDKSRGRTKYVLEALGYTVPPGAFSLSPSKLEGLTAVGTVRTKPNTYNGVTKDKTSVVDYKPAPGASANAVVDAAMGLPGTTVANDDDIPF